MTHDLEHRSPISFYIMRPKTLTRCYSQRLSGTLKNVLTYDLKYFTSDGAVQIKNALGEVYNLDTVVYKNDL